MVRDMLAQFRFYHVCALLGRSNKTLLLNRFTFLLGMYLWGGEVMKNLWSFLVLIYVLGMAVPAQATVNQATIIKGFAEWQASRIEDIVLELGLIQISNNPHVKTVFPSTATVILTERDYMGPALATVVERAMKKDLDIMKYITGQCLPELLNNSADKLKQQIQTDGTLKNGFDEAVLKQVLADLKRIYQGFQAIGGSKSIDFSAINDNEKTKGKIQNTLDFDDKVCYLTEYDRDWIPVSLKSTDVTLYFKAIEEWVKSGDFVNDKHFKRFIVENRLGRMVEYLRDVYVIAERVNSFERYSESMTRSRIEKDKEVVLELDSEIYKDMVSTYKNNLDAIGYAAQVHELMKIMDVYIGFGGNNYPGFLELKRASLFLAYLADASNVGSTEVALVLRQYVDGKSAYRDKREPTGYAVRFTRHVPRDNGVGVDSKAYKATCFSRFLTCRKTLFLSSFWGVAWSHDEGDPPISKSQDGFRAFGPVGLEWKWFTWDGNAISWNYAPIDIGAYVENELTDSEYSASFSDISSPSLFISWTARNYPFAILAGHQWNLKSDRGEEDSYFLAFTFDLPILTLR